jgi:hypothetical protein
MAMRYTRSSRKRTSLRSEMTSFGCTSNLNARTFMYCVRYYAGGDLASWLKRYPPSTRDLATQIRLLRDLLVGLASLHSVRAQIRRVRLFIV